MKTWAEAEFERTKEQWNKKAHTLATRMLDMPDHALYAVWIKNQLQLVHDLYLRVCAQYEALKNIQDG